MKKIITFVLLIIACLASSYTAGEAMGLFRKATGEFRFEDYKSAEAAQEALLKLHPVGSDILLFKQTLELAGASCSLLDKRSKKVNKLLNSDVIVRCDYIQKEFFLTYQWVVLGMQDDTPPFGLIKEIKVIKALSVI